VREDAVRHALNDASSERHVAAGNTIDQLFARLNLVPRIPVSLIADASVAFVEGLVMGGEFSTCEPRVSFDVFWLAMLSLAD
jgi:hypothetical protein